MNGNGKMVWKDFHRLIEMGEDALSVLCTLPVGREESRLEAPQQDLAVIIHRMSTRKPYPSDVTDEEWQLVVPYLTLMDEKAPQRSHDLRDIFNAMRWLLRTGASWRMMPHDFPPWPAVYQQMQRWLKAGCFDALVHDLRAVLRLREGRATTPTAVVLDSRTLQSTPESGARAGYDGAKKRKGSKAHIAVDTLGHLLAVVVTPANEQDRSQVAALAEQVQSITG